jgi:hypothetical protein
MGAKRKDGVTGERSEILIDFAGKNELEPGRLENCEQLPSRYARRILHCRSRDAAAQNA